MQETLKPLLQKLEIPDEVVTIISHSGARNLEKSLPRKLRGWQNPDARFLVLRDNDSGDCSQRKQKLADICAATGKAEATTIRIVCQELEAWFLGDLQAIEQSDLNAVGNIARQQNKAKYRTPDKINKPSSEMEKLVKGYQKVSGAQAIAPHLSIDENCSSSFGIVLRSLKKFKLEMEA